MNPKELKKNLSDALLEDFYKMKRKIDNLENLEIEKFYLEHLENNTYKIKNAVFDKKEGTPTVEFNLPLFKVSSGWTIAKKKAPTFQLKSPTDARNLKEYIVECFNENTIYANSWGAKNEFEELDKWDVWGEMKCGEHFTAKLSEDVSITLVERNFNSSDSISIIVKHIESGYYLIWKDCYYSSYDGVQAQFDDFEIGEEYKRTYTDYRKVNFND